MSVVLGIKKDGAVYLGADSQTTRGGTRVSLSNPNNYKIWKVRGIENCLMGHVGNLRDACAIRIMNNLVREIDAIHNEIDFEYVVRRIAPMIIDELKEYNYISKDGKFDYMDSRFLFAYKDLLYVIGSDSSIIEVDDCVAIGSGECQAIGSLITTVDEQDPNLRIIKAIKSCAAHDIYVDYPIVLANTADTEFDVLTETNIDSFEKNNENK